MRKSSILLFLICLGAITSKAQNQQAYFQQEVNYQIQVRLDDANHMLFGQESFEYTNNSSDTLRFIYIHLWPNAYRNNQTALAKQFVRNNNSEFQFAADSMRGWIDSLAFADPLGPLTWEYDAVHIDICKVTLRDPLLPGAKTSIQTPFIVKLPGDFSRLGHVGKSYQISQWYPKPAVYDRDGWHQMPYLDLGEFYSEYGSFEVKITLPADYRVASTGVLQEESENEWLHTLSKTKEFPKKDTVLGPDKDRIGKMKTITYKQDRIHDFAFFCAQNFVVRKEDAILESGVTIEAWAFFEPGKRTAWNAGAGYVKRAVESYSKWVGDYPYASATAVQGALSAGGGMEYPMVTVISTGSNDSMTLDNVITHEVGHNWFYGILGSNEREHAWMDEGFNSYVEGRYMKEYYPTRSFGSKIGLPSQFGKGLGGNWFDYISANIFATYGRQDPINTPSQELSSLQYGILSYQRTAFLLEYLSVYLGQNTFDQCMHNYYLVWGFKHPQPKDIQNVFESTSGKKLDWFFDELLNTERQADYSISSLHRDDKSYSFTIKNKGEVAAPYSINLVLGDSIIKAYWYEGHTDTKTVSVNKEACDYIVIDAEYQSSDLFVRNNRIKTKGIFKRSEPLKLTLLTGFSRNKKSAVHLFPSIGYNTADGILLGAMIHNFDVQGKQFNYFLMPMYGLDSKTLGGNFIAKYDWFVRDRKVNKIRLMAQYKRFADYDKIEPSLSVFFQNGRLQKKKQMLALSSAYISHRGALKTIVDQYQSTRLRYVRVKNNALLKEMLTANTMISSGVGFNNLRAEIQYGRTDRLSKKVKLITQVYAGWSNGDGGSYFNLYSAGSNDVAKDFYLFDRVGNNKLGWIGSNQALTDQGSFYSFNKSSNQAMLSASAEFQYSWYFKPYVHGLYANQLFYYEAGFGLNLGIAQVYFPIASNAFISGLPENGKQWGESIRFSLRYNPQSFWNFFELL